MIINSIEVSDKDPNREFEIPNLNTMCEMCSNGEDEDQLLLCDSCDRGYHMYCIGLAHIPEIEYWYCTYCFRKQPKTIQQAQKKAEQEACVNNILPLKRRRLRKISDI